jgi:EmrB/QacA subfamily drug resistance transporter
VTRLQAITERNRKWWTLGAMCFALFMIMLDNTVVNVALPSIQRSLNASLSGLEWTINAYTLTFAVLLVTGGRLGDIFGRRRIFLTGVIVFALSSATAGFAPNSLSLVVSRAVQGVGAAMMMPATLSIITNAFPAHERGKAIGTWAGVSALALAIGPVVGGFLTEHVSWRAIFFLNIPVAITAVIVTLAAARESRDHTVPRAVDYWGVGALTIGIGALVLALIEGNRWGWSSAAVLSLFTLSALGLAAFGIAELKVRNPMIEYRFFRSRTFLATNGIAFSVSFAMLSMFFFMALYMQNILDYSPLEAGVRFLPSTAVIIVAAPIAGRLTDRIGAKVPIVVGLSITAVALYFQSRITPTTGYGHLLPTFVLMGLGIGLTMSPMSTAAMNAVDATKAGGASGILSMSRMVGGTFGVAAVGALFQSISDHRLNDRLADVHLSASQKSWFIDNLGSGDVNAHLHQLPPATADQVGHTLRDTFISSLSASMKLSAAVAAVGALIALLAIEHVKQRRPRTVPALAQDVGRAAPAQPQLPASPTSSP